MSRGWSAVLARLGVPTGDGRIIAPAGGSSRDLPLPMSWQEMSGDGHDGSMVVARIETLRIADGMVTATGSMLDSAPYSVIEQLEAGVIGPSVDLDDIEYTMDDQERIVITSWRIAGATLVAIPAFADVSVTLDPSPAEPMDYPSGNMAEWSAETATDRSTGEARKPAASAVRASTSASATEHPFQTSPAQAAERLYARAEAFGTSHDATRAWTSGSATETTGASGSVAQTPKTTSPSRKPQHANGGAVPTGADSSVQPHVGAKPSDSGGSSGSTWSSSTQSNKAPAESAGYPSTSPQGQALSSQRISTTITTRGSSEGGSARPVTEGLGPSGTIPNYSGARSDGWSSEGRALTASANGLTPPLDWFRDPNLTQATPLTICPPDAEGRVRVFGTIAPWGQCHVGLPGCVTPPSSVSGYSYFMTGEQATAEGPVLPVGTLVAGPRHADMQAAFQAAVAHYDDPSAAVAKVMAGEDEHGIWVAGWMLPGATAEAKEVFRSSPVSGDWRRVGGSLEMIAVCSVNAPGFPVPRARVAFSNGHQRALIGSFGITPVSGAEPAPKVAPETNKMAKAKWAWMIATGTES